MLTVIGDLLDDVVVRLPGPLAALRAGDDNPGTVRRAQGGSAANVAASAAALTPTRFIGRVGDDPAGDALVGSLARRGVDVRVQRCGATGTVVVLVDADGERTMVPDRAAAAELAAVDPRWLAGATWLHLPLYGFTSVTSGDALRAAVATVRDSDTPAGVSLDLSSTSAMTDLGRLGHGGVLDLLELVRPDVVLANEAEAAHVGLLSAAVLPRVPGAVVVKRGAAPVLVVHGPPGGVGGERTVTEVEVPPLPPGTDTTGAGDALAAGYLAAAVARRGASPVACTRAGVLRACQVLSDRMAG